MHKIDQKYCNIFCNIVFLLNFLIVKESWKKKDLEHLISKLEWFLKDHVTLDWSNDAENSALSSQE